MNNYAYIAAGDEGLKTIDVSNPAAPFLKGSYSYTSDGEAYDRHFAKGKVINEVD